MAMSGNRDFSSRGVADGVHIFAMNRFFPLLLALSLGLSAVNRADAWDKTQLPRSTPEAQGMASSELLAFVETAEQEIDALHSFMLMRHGRVVAEGYWEPYSPEVQQTLYSLSKSFTSTAVGIAIAEGYLTVDDTVLSYFPEHAPMEPGPHLKAMRVRDLLRMATGHHHEPALRGESNWIKAFLAQEVTHKPGTYFLYNTPATFMLSAIVQRTTGETVLDYLRPRLFEPLGINNPTWGASPEGITLGGYGLSIRTEDIARFGQLYLQQGQWRGRQLVPSAWIAEATARQTSNGSNPHSDWDQGYGYQFWRCRHNAYRGDGAFGQYCIVLPDQDAVVVITSGVRDMQAVMNLVWDRLLPAMRSAPLREDPLASLALQRKLSQLSLRPVQGASTSPRGSQWVGRLYAFPPNEAGLESLRIESAEPGEVVIRLRREGVDQRIVSAYGAWQHGRMPAGSATPEQAVAVSGAWADEYTYVSRICLYETPHHLIMKLKFEEDRLIFDSEYNVSFGPTRQPQLIGRAHP
jgi:CubicO group peptidase (beta-lactamase class C family)